MQIRPSSAASQSAALLVRLLKRAAGVAENTSAVPVPFLRPCPASSFTAWRQADTHSCAAGKRIEPSRGAHLGPAMDAGPQAQRDESLDGVRQLRLLKVVIEHTGRPWVSHEVGIPLLNAIRGKAPVPLRAALQDAKDT